jgi:pimeloyl-ACP methyl ester carboxylesterase
MKKRYIALIVIGVLIALPYLLLNMRISDRGAICEFRSKGITLGMHTLHIGSHHLHYASIGSDTLPTLIFVHGSPGSWYVWRDYLMDTALRGKYRMIAIDRPGFGFSDFGEAVHIQVQAEIVASLIDSVKTNKPLYLVGHSLGGTIVPLAAAERPDKVTGFVNLAGALDIPTEPAEKWRAYFINFPMRYLMPGAFRQSNIEQWYYKTDMYHFADKLDRIKGRVCLLHASNDDIVDVANVAYMKKAFSGAVVTDTIFKDGGHFIPWNHREYVTKLLLSIDN